MSFAALANLLAAAVGNADAGASSTLDPRVVLTQISYLGASVLFIFGLKGLTNPAKARRGMQLAALGMAVAVIGTLIDAQIITYGWIIAGMVLGSAIGAAISIWMPMTAVPQRTAISHAFGALAATMVGIAHFHEAGTELPVVDKAHVQTAAAMPTTSAPAPPTEVHSIGRVEMAALGFEVLFGSLTITGSVMAFGKLQGLVPSQPITYRGQNASNISLFVIGFLLFVYLTLNPAGGLSGVCFYMMIAIGLAVGVLIVLPIGGADMPVVISLLNSYAGLASSATGFALHNSVLIIAGALDGASGFLLSILMSKAMNRSFTNVIFGAFGGGDAVAGTTMSTEGLTVHSISVDDAALQLAYARLVIVVPGYGMAVAQAQHQVRELAELIEKRGGEVKYAIHPVAGRMPGHMNVLLAEANVPYDRLYDMEDINHEFGRADVALIIGANDVVNPAARNDASSPIYGMPILNADQAQRIIVLKRSMNPGFSGIENELFYNPKASLLFGDAKSSLTQLVSAVKNA
ncbi:MAG TPA: NAD(P)(+) transhydrogenase (Re/Si-specific) subunit beta [Pirellulales bacterium]|nr:NAD(P)(+) transhydrogenase (Re/Si-specific) subunit beta [Pirellulales bacterium]